MCMIPLWAFTLCVYLIRASLAAISLHLLICYYTQYVYILQRKGPARPELRHPLAEGPEECSTRARQGAQFTRRTLGSPPPHAKMQTGKPRSAVKSAVRARAGGLFSRQNTLRDFAAKVRRAFLQYFRALRRHTPSLSPSSSSGKKVGGACV